MATKFLAEGVHSSTHYVYTSSDGLTWGRITHPAGSPAPGYAIAHNPDAGTFLMAGGNNFDSIFLYDEGTWTDQGTPPVSPEILTYGDGVWLLAGGGDLYRSTDDGDTWTVVTGFFRSNPNNIAYGDGAWLAGGSSGTIQRSTNGGATFASVGTLPGSTGTQVVAFAYNPDDSLWLAMSDRGECATSADGGATWTAAGSVGNNQSKRGLVYGNGKFFTAAFNITNAHYSTDNGATWTSTKPHGSLACEGHVAYSAGLFLAVLTGGNDEVMSSPLTGTPAWTVELSTSSGAQVDTIYGIAGAPDTNNPPNAPLLAAPGDGAAIDRNSTQRFDWDFSDPDSGDSQSKYDLRYRLVGAGTWTDVTGTTPNTYHDFAGGTFASGDYEWQVRTYDAQGVVGPYSSSSFFTAGDAPATPTITAPINGATVSQAETVMWSAPDQTSYQLRRVADNAGTPDTATVYSDTGEVASTTARSLSVDFPDNDRYEHVQLRIKHDGLWSAWVSHRVLVSWTPPPAPSGVLAVESGTGSILLTITNPTPDVGEPPVVENHVYVTDPGKSEERRVVGVVPNGSWRYMTPPSGFDGVTVGAVRILAVADNGITSSST